MDDKQALQAELYKILDKNSLVVTDTLAAKAITELITFIDAYTEQRLATAREVIQAVREGK